AIGGNRRPTWRPDAAAAARGAGVDNALTCGVTIIVPESDLLRVLRGLAADSGFDLACSVTGDIRPAGGAASGRRRAEYRSKDVCGLSSTSAEPTDQAQEERHP